MPGGSGRSKEAVPTERQDPGYLDPRGWWRAFNLRSCCHPRPPPPPQLPAGPLPRCRGSLEGCRRKAIRPPAGRGNLPGPGKGIAPAGGGNATRVSPTRANRVQRPPVAGRALVGGFGPKRAKDQRGAVAGAMAPAMGAVRVLSSTRAGTGNATRVSPARAQRRPVDRQVLEERRAAPGPAGAKRPPGAGRALAGGFGPRRTRAMLSTGPGR